MLGEEWEENPAIVAAPEAFEVVRLFDICCGWMGFTMMPEGGAVMDQAAWLIDAFGIVAKASEQARKAEGR